MNIQDKNLKIALLGYGKMGKEIETISNERNHNILTTIDNDEDWEKNFDLFKNADVAIEFSTPQNVEKNILNCFKENIPVVVGTTAWYERFDKIKQECINSKATLFHASNFSIGVNILFELNKKLANLINKHNNYNVVIDEIHHTQKLDSPSGTAITLANDIIANFDNKTAWINNDTEKTNELSIVSHRIGNTTGTHSIVYDSNIDTIEIRHAAKNRKGFALGAILAAEWIIGKNGVFEMSDMLM